MRLSRHRFNTLRNQMLFGFLFVMLIILSLVGMITFDSVSRLLQDNTEKHVQQTAIQASGRLEAVLTQIDSLTTQVATSAYVQQVLLNEYNGKMATFSERQALVSSVKLVQAYAEGVQSVELYNDQGKRLFPLDGDGLLSRVSSPWVDTARNSRGRIVWIGLDPSDPESVLSIRSISLIDHWFEPGGFLLVRMKRDIFNISHAAGSEGSPETMLLAGRNNSLIATSDPTFTNAKLIELMNAKGPVVTLAGKQYMQVRQQSEVTGWTLLLLTPIHEITGGISVLRTAILVSAGIGTILFALLSFALSTLITRPIFKLIKTMRSARLGGLKPVSHISSTIEINELHYSYNQMVEHMNNLIELVYEKELLQTRTEFKALQAQIHPHFLFNTLEALYWSLQEKGEESLAEYVVKMADLFRYTISTPGQGEWVTLSEELQHIERYLDIMKLRFDDRIAWRLDVPPDCSSIHLPKLLVQPLVENAVLHGLERKLGAGFIAVTARRDDDLLHITVEDDGGGMTEERLRSIVSALHSSSALSPASSGAGMGLLNIQQRVLLHFGQGKPEAVAGLRLAARAGGGTIATLAIPLTSKGVRQHACDKDDPDR